MLLPPTESSLRLGFENTSKEHITSGQLHRPNIPRNVRSCSKFPAIGSNWGQLQMIRVSRLEGK